MTRAQLVLSQAMWHARERWRYRRWRHYVRTRPAADPSRAKWHALYVTARDRRWRRDHQLARLAVAHVSQAGLAFLTQHEGVVLHPYNDSQGHATIGVGHLIHRGPVTPRDRRAWQDFTLTEARLLLAHDLERFEAAVRGAFHGAGLPATPNRFDACVSLAFNIGAGGFASSSVAREIRAGHEHAAADAFLLWAHPPELLGRRRDERSLFLRAG